MSDLTIDDAVLQHLERGLTEVTDLLADTCALIAHAPTDLSPDTRLLTRLHDFGDGWEYGVHRLARFSAGLVDALRDVDATFRSLDEDLTRALADGSAAP